MFPQLRQFWDMFQTKLADKNPYNVSISGMRLRLSKLQESDAEAQKVRAKELKDGQEKFDEVLHYQGLLFMPEIIQIELISRHYNNSLVGHFGFDKTRKFVGRKYYWSSLQRDVEAYVKDCDVCLVLKVVKHKLYSDLQTLPIQTYR